MTGETRNTNQASQIDSLASALAELKPASAETLASSVFYRAGLQAGRSQRPRPASSFGISRAAIVGLLVLSNFGAFMAGRSQSVPEQLAIVSTSIDQASTVEAARASVDEASPEVAKVLPGASAMQEQTAALPLIAKWLAIPRLSPTEYEQRVERRTSPVRLEYVATGPPIENPIKGTWLPSLHKSSKFGALHEWPPR